MFAKLKAAWSRLAGGGAAGGGEGPAVPPVEYKGFRIRPARYLASGAHAAALIDERNAQRVK